MDVKKRQALETTLPNTLPSTAQAKFKEAIETIANFARQEGIELKSYSDSSLPKFSALPPAQQDAIADNTVNYVEILSSLKWKQELLRYNLNGVWLTLSKSGLRPCSEMFKLLKSSDTVEIYDLSGIQTFRSFHFFELCSFTLEDLWFFTLGGGMR